jgi:arylsulfatase A-like enzyme
VSFFHRLTPFVLLGVLLSGFCAAGEKRPNIIIVFIDDMGWADFSCFGNEDAKTPNIDRLANEGIRFEQFYVNSPICSPSRVAISTGQYPQRWRISSYLGHRAQNEKRGMAQWLDPQAPMLAKFLQKSGYATGHFGKWHMGGQRDVKDAPAITEYGFDQSLTNFEGMGPKLLPLTLKPGQDPKKTGRIWHHAEHLGNGYKWMQRSEITCGFVDAALPFIDKAQKEGKPFYLNLWPDDVHSPYWPPVDKWGDGKKRTLYLAVLEEMDRQLGKLFDRVRNDPELANNTMILICSDNGPDPGAGSAEPLRGYKTHLYEGGIRSPLIVWAPGLMNEKTVGKVNKTSVFSAIDLVPTLAEICKSPLPQKVIFDGEELTDILLGKSDRSRKEPIFFRRPPDRDSFFGVKNLPDLAVRSGKWKLLCEYDGERAELYDLIKDPSESTDLADQVPEIRDRLIKLVTVWHQSMPADNGPNLVASKPK